MARRGLARPLQYRGTMNAKNETNCTCGGCPALRVARGLLPFCRLPRPEGRTKDAFGSYGAAASALKPGERVLCVTRSGGPKRFICVK